MIAAKNGHVLKSSKMASLLDGVKSVLISMRIVVVDKQNDPYDNSDNRPYCST